MVLPKLKHAAGILLALTFLGGAGSWLGLSPTPGAAEQPATDASLEATLPKGAVVRFGTTRYRAGHVAGAMKLSPDGKKLITGGRTAGNGLFVWDAVTGKRILHLPFGQEGEISRDGERLFVIECQPLPPVKPAKLPVDPKNIKVIIAGDPEPVELKCTLNIYQLATGKLVQHIQSPKRLAHFALAPNERTLALEYAVPDLGGGKVDDGFGGLTIGFKSLLELYDLKTGRILHDLGELPRDYYRLVRFSADGKTLFEVSVSPEFKSYASTVRRFDVATGALKSKKVLHGDAYRRSLDAVGKTLIFNGSTIWDLEKERMHWVPKGKELDSIFAIMPDGRTILGLAKTSKELAGDKTASRCVLWDMETDREIRRVPNASSTISPDGKICYGTAWMYRWFRYDLASGKEFESVDAPTEPAESIAFSPDGKVVATLNNISSADKTYDPTQKYFVVRVWDRATGKRLHQMSAFLGNLLFFTPDSRTLAYGAVGSSLLTLDTATWKETKRDFEQLPTGHFMGPQGVQVHQCKLSPDGKILAAPTALWDWGSGKLIGKLEHKFPDGAGIDQGVAITFSADSKKLTCLGYPDKRVLVWNLADRKIISDKRISDWPTLRGDTTPQFIDGGKLLAVGVMPHRGPWRGMLRFREHMNDPIPADWPATMPSMPNAVIHVWDAATGKEKFRFKYSQNENMSDIPPLFSPDGKLAVTANYSDSLVRFWDLATGKEVGQFLSPGNGVHAMVFSPDSGVLAVSANDTTVLLVDMRKVLSKP